MSLFVGGFAFTDDVQGEEAARLGVLMGSLTSLGLAAVVLRLWPRAAPVI